METVDLAEAQQQDPILSRVFLQLQSVTLWGLERTPLKALQAALVPAVSA